MLISSKTWGPRGHVTRRAEHRSAYSVEPAPSRWWALAAAGLAVLPLVLAVAGWAINPGGVSRLAVAGAAVALGMLIAEQREGRGLSGGVAMLWAVALLGSLVCAGLDVAGACS